MQQLECSCAALTRCICLQHLLLLPPLGFAWPPQQTAHNTGRAAPTKK
jgi:hypothetical protein